MSWNSHEACSQNRADHVTQRVQAKCMNSVGAVWPPSIRNLFDSYTSSVVPEREKLPARSFQPGSFRSLCRPMQAHSPIGPPHIKHAQVFFSVGNLPVVCWRLQIFVFCHEYKMLKKEQKRKEFSQNSKNSPLRILDIRTNPFRAREAFQRFSPIQLGYSRVSGWILFIRIRSSQFELVFESS